MNALEGLITSARDRQVPPSRSTVPQDPPPGQPSSASSDPARSADAAWLDRGLARKSALLGPLGWLLDDPPGSRLLVCLDQTVGRAAAEALLVIRRGPPPGDAVAEAGRAAAHHLHRRLAIDVAREPRWSASDELTGVRDRLREAVSPPAGKPPLEERVGPEVATAVATLLAMLDRYFDTPRPSPAEDKPTPHLRDSDDRR